MDLGPFQEWLEERTINETNNIVTVYLFSCSLFVFIHTHSTFNPHYCIRIV